MNTKAIPLGERFLAICDCGINAGSGKWEVKNQRDWNVPDFTPSNLMDLCESAGCENKNDCSKCIVTRIKEAVFEDVY